MNKSANRPKNNNKARVQIAEQKRLVKEAARIKAGLSHLNHAIRNLRVATERLEEAAAA